MPALTPRGFSLALALTGQTTNLTQAGVVLQNVRATWIPVPPAAPGAAAPAGNATIDLASLDTLAQQLLAGG